MPNFITEGSRNVGETPTAEFLPKRDDDTVKRFHSDEANSFPTLTEDNTFDGESDLERLRLEMQLFWAKDRNTSLELKLGKVTNENQALQAQLNDYRDSMNSISRTNASTVELQTKLDLAMNRINDKDLQLTMTKMSLKEAEGAGRTVEQQEIEMKLLRTENSGLQLKIQELSSEIDSVRLEHKKVQTRNSRQLDEIGDLMTENENLRAEIRHLTFSATRNSDLSAQISGLVARLDHADKEKDNDKEHVRRLSAENQDLHEKTTHLKAESIRRHEGYTRLLDDIRVNYIERNKLGDIEAANVRLTKDFKDIKAIETTLRHQVNTLRTENTEIRTTNKVQHNKIVALEATVNTPRDDQDLDQLKSDLAYCVTELDLASAGLRVFTCAHDNLEDIPDGNNSTREKPIFLIANEIFYKWQDDERFIELYRAVRQRVVNHHSAHERVGQGRGAYTSEIRKEYQQADHHRGVNITYY